MNGPLNFFNLQDEESNRGVSAVIGVLILVVLTLLLVSGVYFTATNLTSNNPEDLTAGTTTERVSPYEYQTTLVTNGNANHIQVVSPLGTKYNLTEVGDSSKILAVQYNSNSQVNRLQITASSSEGESTQRQLLKSQTVDNGINPDLIVDKYGTGDYTSIQTAINNAPPATADNPAVIVVEKATYTENIDVSQNITLIAEHGTVIQDADPNEPVVHMKGDDSQVRNFEVNSDPKANDDHYASHGVLVDGENAQIVGNSLSNAQSPDLNSAGISINSKNSFIQYNNFNSNERSISLQSNAESPLVCGNQLSNSIGGFVSDQTKQELAMNNYWENGIPSNLVPEKMSSKMSGTELTQRQSLSAASSRVPVSLLPKESRAGQPFPGTQLSSDSEGASIEGCDVNVNFVNTGLTFSLSDIRVLINGGTPLAVYESSSQPSTSGQELANEKGETVAVCSCGGDGSYDDGDVISVYQPSSDSSTSSSEGDSSSADSGASFPQNPATDTDYTVVETTGSDDSPSYTPVDENSVEEVSSVSPPENTDTESSTDDDTSSDLGVELGDKITAEVGDELVLMPVLNGTSENASYQWDFDDGSTASTKEVQHIYTTKGTYNVSLTVSQDNTSETATDSVTIEITESSSSEDFNTVSSSSELQSIVTDSGSTGSDTVYLSSGTYSISEVSNPNLKIVGQESGVVFENRVSVTSSGVTFKNVELQDGLSVSTSDFKLYGSTVSSDDSYSVEIATSESNIYLGSNSITGSNNGVYVDASSDVIVKNNDIEAKGSGSSAVRFDTRMKNVEVTQNSLTANENGIYVGHATTLTHSENDFTAPTNIYKVPNQPPSINDISVDVTLAHLPVNLNVDASDPQGDRLTTADWVLDNTQKSTSVSGSVSYTVDSAGDYTPSVTVTDELGKSATSSKTYTFEQPTLSLTAPSEISVGSKMTVSVDTNVPDYRIASITYDWGDGTSSTTTSHTQSHSYSQTNSQSVQVTITTDSGFTLTETVEVSVVNSPVAFYSVDQGETDGIVGGSITFNASASTSPDENGLTYKWDFNNDGTIDKTGRVVSHNFNDFGSYSTKLIVETSSGLTDSTVKTLEMTDVGFDVSITNTGVNVPTKVDVSTSEDSVTEKYQVDWNGDGSFDETITDISSSFTHTYTSTGEYTVKIKAVGYDSSQTSTYTEQITVQDAPEFDISFNPSSPTTADSITMDLVNTANMNNPSVKWDFDDGTVSTGLQVSHSYSAAKKYTVKVTVEDSDGISKTKTKQITVGTAKQVLYQHNWGDDGWGIWTDANYTPEIKNGYLHLGGAVQSESPLGSNRGDFYLKVQTEGSRMPGLTYTIGSNTFYNIENYRLYAGFGGSNSFDTQLQSGSKWIGTNYHNVPTYSRDGGDYVMIIQYDASENQLTYDVGGKRFSESAPSGWSNWENKYVYISSWDYEKLEYIEYGYGYQFDN